MKIAYLHQYYRTPEQGGAIRSYYLSSELVKAGHSVVMITTHNEPGVLIKEINGVQVHYLPVDYDNKMPVIRRLVAFFRYLRLAYRQVRIIADIELVYATSTPLTVGVLAMKIKRKLGIPYIFEVRDLWPDAPIEMGYIPLKFLARLTHLLESRIYKTATHIIALSKGMAQRIQLRSPSSPVTVIPNISDTSFFKLTPFLPKERIVIGYFGAIGKVNGLDDLLEIAHHCQQIGLNVSFEIFGKGSQEGQLRRSAQMKKLTNVKFHGLLSKHSLRNQLTNIDIAFISFADYPILETSSPNKFFDAIASGKMVITNTGGWIRNLIEENTIGFYFERGNPSQFVSLLTLYLNDMDRIGKAQQQARLLAESRFSIEILGRRLNNLISESKQSPLRKLA